MAVHVFDAGLRGTHHRRVGRYAARNASLGAAGRRHDGGATSHGATARVDRASGGNDAATRPDDRPRTEKTHGAVVETDRPLVPAIGPLADDAAEYCRVSSAEPLRIEIEARLDSAGLVVLSDLFYPGWELTEEVGGLERQVPIVRTNRVLRGAALSAGDHRLVYRYRPPSVWLGGLLSGLGLLLLAALGVVDLRRRRKRVDATNLPAAMAAQV
jgi:hypothetical protein